MSSPTVELIGLHDLARIPDFLRLGAVVVVAPDRTSLKRWREEANDAGDRSGVPSKGRSPKPGLAVDVSGRRAMWDGDPIAFTDLEFQVIAILAREPGRAWSFSELRRAGWGPNPGGAIDVYAVRSVIQRIRGKLRGVTDLVAIESVRGFGFRLSIAERRVRTELRSVGNHGLAHS